MQQTQLADNPWLPWSIPSRDLPNEGGRIRVNCGEVKKHLGDTAI
jgi:hypothetical protein